MADYANRTLIIAEAGVNHNGSLEIAKKLIDVAAEAGADIIKFQTFKTENLVTKFAKKAAYQKSDSSNETGDFQFDMLKKLELTEENHFELIEYCKSQYINFLSTAFDLDSLTFLNKLKIETYKIPSGEITNLPYLKQIGSYNKKIILSTGMSSIREIADALDVLQKAGTPKEKIIVLHCTSEYPTPMIDVNLRAMLTIKNKFGVNVGYSDHTNGIEVAIAAVALGAVVIEKHFTLNKNMEGPDHKASLEPKELQAMVTAIRNIEKALGSELKQPSESEQKNIAIVRKSIHLKNDLPKDHILSVEDLIMKRPAVGISPMEMDKVIGKKLNRFKQKDDFLTWEDFE